MKDESETVNFASSEVAAGSFLLNPRLNVINIITITNNIITITGKNIATTQTNKSINIFAKLHLAPSF